MPDRDLITSALARVESIERFSNSRNTDALCALVRALLDGHEGEELFQREQDALRRFAEGSNA